MIRLVILLVAFILASILLQSYVKEKYSVKHLNLTPHQIRYCLNSGKSLNLVDTRHNIHILVNPLNKYVAQIIILNKSFSQIYHSKTSIAQELVELLDNKDILIEEMN